MWLRKIIREYFYFSAGEKRGLLVMIFILVMVYALPYFVKNNPETNSINNHAEIDSLLQKLEIAKNNAEKENTIKEVTSLFSFDPNTIDSLSLSKLGFSRFQIRNLLRYRKKGGKFRKKEDLLRLYGFDKNLYKKLNPYIQLNTSTPHTNSLDKPVGKTLFAFDPNHLSDTGWDSLGVKKYVVQAIRKFLQTGARFTRKEDLQKIYGLSPKKYNELAPYIQIASSRKTADTEKLSVELNTADSVELTQLPGIGHYFSKRIIRYREILGGFAKKTQLFEVYGLSDSVVQHLLPLVTIDDSRIALININKADALLLKKHPYITYRQARDIVRFREKNGTFTTVETLKQHKLLPDSIFLKLKPYLITY